MTMTDQSELWWVWGRWRCALRAHLPWFLIWLAPKSRRDCGLHQWYRSDESTWRCYFCRSEKEVEP